MNGLLIDYKWCSGCHSCEVACKNEHDIPLGRWGIKVTETGPWQIGEDVWHHDFIPTPTSLCDLCADRVEQGRQPSCVQHCQAKVMEYGPLEELTKRAEAKGEKVVIYLP